MGGIKLREAGIPTPPIFGAGHSSTFRQQAPRGKPRAQIAATPPKLFHRVVLPQAVYDEIVADGAGLPGAEEIAQAEWVVIKTCSNRVLVNALF